MHICFADIGCAAVRRKSIHRDAVQSGLSQRQFRFVWFLLNLSEAPIFPWKKKILWDCKIGVTREFKIY